MKLQTALQQVQALTFLNAVLFSEIRLERPEDLSSISDAARGRGWEAEIDTDRLRVRITRKTAIRSNKA